MTGLVRPLWRCKACGRRFANRNQPHACGRHSLADHFAGKPPEIRELFDQFLEAARSCGPLTLLPEKTRIALQVRMSFAALMPQKSALRGHLVLARREERGGFLKIESISPRNHVHHFRLVPGAGVTRALRRYIAQAYAVGKQEHDDQLD